LRESGAIEQDADVVLFLHREEYYDRKDASLTGKGELIIAKAPQWSAGDGAPALRRAHLPVFR
jgi:hypothetical protein